MFKRNVIMAWLEYGGWWFPPDAIDAVHQGRETYHALDPNVTWPLKPAVRVPIERAIERARESGWNYPS